VLQLAAVTTVLVSLGRPGLVQPEAQAGVFYASGAITALAGLQYMYRGLAWLQRQAEGPAADVAASGDRAEQGSPARSEERRRA
jgi:hypothetical protein